MIGVRTIDRAQAIARTADSLGLPAPQLAGCLGRPLVAQSLRRIVFIAAPCTYRTARELALKALGPLAGDSDTLPEQIDDLLDYLVAMGDLLESRPEGASILRPAPPAFVRRPDGTFAVLGIAGEEITPALDEQVVHRPSGLRTIHPDDPQACRRALMDLGLTELRERTWLHAPPAVQASTHVSEWIARLPEKTSPERVEGLEMLDTARPVSCYKGRWTAPDARHAGYFLARRPQRYGAKLWSLADMRGGIAQRFVDIHPKDSRLRACDEAWRLQAAFDAAAGAPQTVLTETHGPVVRLSFSSPLPAWAVRRLSIVGEQTQTPRALLAFDLPAANAEEEVRWLGEMLWLKREDRGAQ